MSVQRQSVPSSEGDLESTAELPVLDVAAYEAARGEERSGSTDTWIMPTAARASAAALVTAAAQEHGTQLEVDLRSLSESLRDVEGRLTRKGERLIELERELAEAQADRLATEERAAAVTVELDAARTELGLAAARLAELQHGIEHRDSAARQQQTRDRELTAQLAAADAALLAARRDLSVVEVRAAQYLESLTSLEGRRVVFEGMLCGLEHDVQERDGQISGVARELAQRTVRTRELEAELGDRARRIGSLEGEVNALAAALGQRNAELDRSQREHARLSESIASLTEMLKARAERVRALEAALSNQSESVSERVQELERMHRERHALAANLAAFEAALAGANTRLAEQEHAAAATAAERAELETRHAGSRLRVAELEREIAAAGTSVKEYAAVAQRAEAEREQHTERLAIAETRSSGLQAQLAERDETIRLLQDELRASLTRATELEADLRAAEDAIHRVEADLRGKSARLDELAKSSDEWRGTLENARHTLADRDSVIQRLEAEAANSAVLLGTIQQSIKRLDPGTSGNYEVAPEGAVRLLVRVDGDSEVVHVLSRKTTIGRTPDNDLQIDAKFISRHHAVILAGPTHTIIEDLNSTNGVSVNGRRITRHTLRDGDTVAIGKTHFRFAARPTGDRR